MAEGGQVRRPRWRRCATVPGGARRGAREGEAAPAALGSRRGGSGSPARSLAGSGLCAWPGRPFLRGSGQLLCRRRLSPRPGPFPGGSSGRFPGGLRRHPRAPLFGDGAPGTGRTGPMPGLRPRGPASPSGERGGLPKAGSASSAGPLRRAPLALSAARRVAWRELREPGALPGEPTPELARRGAVWAQMPRLGPAVEPGACPGPARAVRLLPTVLHGPENRFDLTASSWLHATAAVSALGHGNIRKKENVRNWREVVELELRSSIPGDNSCTSSQLYMPACLHVYIQHFVLV